MTSVHHHEGRNISRDLCDGIARLTAKRLAFDTKMRQRGLTYSADSCMSVEGRVTYLKLRGDQLLHLAEIARHNGEVSMPECEGLAAEALEAYVAAQDEASSNAIESSDVVNSRTNTDNGRSHHSSSSSSSALPELHPLRIELALRISSVLLHLLDRPIEAWGAAYPTYVAATERPTRLGARGLAVTQVLRDHLACIGVRGGGSGYQQEGSSACKNSVGEEPTHVQDPTGGFAGGDEWGFLRMAPGFDEGSGAVVGIGSTASGKLRALAQLKQARSCLDGMTAATRVLLGTMEHANAVRSALKEIFDVYCRKNAQPAKKCSDDGHGTTGKHVWLQGRKATPRAFNRQGPFLSWPGFESVCHDFNITTAATVSPAADLSHPPAQNNHHDRSNTTHHAQFRSTSPDNHRHRSPKTNAAAPAATVVPRTSSPPPRMLLGDTATAVGGLLSRLQARIAFVSACTHGSVVASFPDPDGTSVGNNVVVSGGRGGGGERECRTDAGIAGTEPGRVEEGDGIPSTDGDTAYWRAVERVILSGAAPDDKDAAPGLNFRQFVDGLARCGLIGYSKNGTGIKQCVSAAERMQDVFIARMRLLDREHVETALQQQQQQQSAEHLTAGAVAAVAGKREVAGGERVHVAGVERARGTVGSTTGRGKANNRRGPPREER
ncbi:unnamed protein product [Ectocarpus sp. CCAP 1310/34]|nr:unnamed protein product [Ectocarpus sp. CCAP 1310/34]